ncbi:MAG: hypothetical protein NTX33_04360 [Propionibacteriales bacterium]|nr:hypothetical protein [Propionibacteriales bacterium]
MSDLHIQLRELVTAVGRSVVEDAETFRAALDDYLDERAASRGELNLLVDAVRLGAVRRAVEQIGHGGDPSLVIDVQADALARDRGVGESSHAAWAIAALGFAMGSVSAGEVIRRLALRDRRTTAEPPPAVTKPVGGPPVVSPPYPPPPPVHPPPWELAGAGRVSPPRKGRAGLVVGTIVTCLVLLIGAGVGVWALTRGEGDGAGPRDAGSAGPTGPKSPERIDKDLRGAAVELFPADSVFSSLSVSSWSVEPDNIAAGEPRELTGEERDGATLWTLFHTNESNNFYIDSQFFATDFESGDAQCNEDDLDCSGRQTPGGQAAVMRVLSDDSSAALGETNYYRLYVVAGDADTAQVTVGESFSAAKGLKALDVVARMELVETDVLAALDDPRLVVPVPAQLPPLPSFLACTVLTDPPAGCPEL